MAGGNSSRLLKLAPYIIVRPDGRSTVALLYPPAALGRLLIEDPAAARALIVEMPDHIQRIQAIAVATWRRWYDARGPPGSTL